MLKPVLVIARVFVQYKGGGTTATGTERMFFDLHFPCGNMTGMSPPSFHFIVMIVD